ncbi:MAG: hypothetical protein WCO69_05620 [Candidatus Omnitrophota bacterium]
MTFILPDRIKRFIGCATLASFIVTSSLGYAQTAVILPAPGSMVALSEPFHPATLEGMKVYADAPLRFDFILDPADVGENTGLVSEKLVRYFLASLTVPEKDLWVNLSPYEKDRIIPDVFGLTELGRDLLAQDYILKQLTASLLYPEGETGKKFWAELYARAYQKYGSTDIPVDAFNKVWIMPAKAVVYEKADAQRRTASVYVVESRLKVLLESDYLAQANNSGAKEASASASIGLAKDVLRSVVIPVLEKEVNEGTNFAPLRQAYHSLILAAWYKKKVQGSLLSRAYVDRNRVAGVNIDDPRESEKIWGRYVQAFKKGAVSLIREEKDTFSGEVIPRKYFSGGVNASQISTVLDTSGQMDLFAAASRKKVKVSVDLALAESSLASGVSGLGTAWVDQMRAALLRVPVVSGGKRRVALLAVNLDANNNLVSQEVKAAADSFTSSVVNDIRTPDPLTLWGAYAGGRLAGIIGYQTLAGHRQLTILKENGEAGVRELLMLRLINHVYTAWERTNSKSLALFKVNPADREYFKGLGLDESEIRSNDAANDQTALMSGTLYVADLPRVVGILLERLRGAGLIDSAESVDRAQAFRIPVDFQVALPKVASRSVRDRVYKELSLQEGAVADYFDTWTKIMPGAVDRDHFLSVYGFKSNVRKRKARVLQKGVIEYAGKEYIFKQGDGKDHNIGWREKLGSELFAGSVNVVGIKVLPDGAHYLTQIATDENMRKFNAAAGEVAPKIFEDPLEATSRMFVGAVGIGWIYDYRLNNKVFMPQSDGGYVPVLIDMDQFRLTDVFPATDKGLGSFIYHFLKNALLSPARSMLALDQKEREKLTRYPDLLEPSPADVKGLIEEIKKYRLGPAYIAAEGLTADGVRKAIRDLKRELTDARIRYAVAVCGSGKGQADREGMVRALQQRRETLGRTIGKVWEVLTGEDPGFDALDDHAQTTVDLNVLKAEARRQVQMAYGQLSDLLTYSRQKDGLRDILSGFVKDISRYEDEVQSVSEGPFSDDLMEDIMMRTLLLPIFNGTDRFELRGEKIFWFVDQVVNGEKGYCIAEKRNGTWEVMVPEQPDFQSKVEEYFSRYRPESMQKMIGRLQKTVEVLEATHVEIMAMFKEVQSEKVKGVYPFAWEGQLTGRESLAALLKRIFDRRVFDSQTAETQVLPRLLDLRAPNSLLMSGYQGKPGLMIVLAEEKDGREVFADDMPLRLMDNIVAYLRVLIDELQPALNKQSGGIDLALSRVNLETGTSGEGLLFNIDPALLDRIEQATGLKPVIVDIQPAVDLRSFLAP